VNGEEKPQNVGDEQACKVKINLVRGVRSLQMTL